MAAFGAPVTVANPFATANSDGLWTGWVARENTRLSKTEKWPKRYYRRLQFNVEERVEKRNFETGALNASCAKAKNLKLLVAWPSECPRFQTPSFQV